MVSGAEMDINFQPHKNTAIGLEKDIFSQ